MSGSLLFDIFPKKFASKDISEEISSLTKQQNESQKKLNQKLKMC